jgi:hypothetical protein
MNIERNNRVMLSGFAAYLLTCSSASLIAQTTNNPLTGAELAQQQVLLNTQIGQFAQQYSDLLTRANTRPPASNRLDAIVQSIQNERLRQAGIVQKGIADQLDSLARQLDAAQKRWAKPSGSPGSALIPGVGFQFRLAGNANSAQGSAGINIGLPRSTGKASSGADQSGCATSASDPVAQVRAFAANERSLSVQSLNLAQTSSMASASGSSSQTTGGPASPPTSERSRSGQSLNLAQTSSISPTAGSTTHSAGVPALPPASPSPKSEAIPALPEKTASVQEALLGRLSANPRLAFSHDGQHVAWVNSKDGEMTVSVDGHEGPSFNEVEVGDFTPEGGHLIYRARQGRAWVLVVDGNVAPDYDSAGHMAVDRSGTHMAYIAFKGQKATVFVDGKQGATYASTDGGVFLTFSSDGKHYAYLAGNTVIVDGQEQSSGGIVYPHELLFSEDGAHLVYTIKDGKRWFVVADGNKGKEYDLVEHPRFLPGSDRLAFVAAAGSKVMWVVDGQEGPHFEPQGSSQKARGEPGLQNFVSTKDGKRFAYKAAKSPSTWVVVVDGKEDPVNDDVESLLFSGDGKHYAYAAYRQRKWVVVLDGNDGKEFERVSEIAINKDGTRLAFVIPGSQTGMHAMVVDGKSGKNYWRIWRPMFSPDGKHVVYGANRTPPSVNFGPFPTESYDYSVADTLVIDDKELSASKLLFTSDGSHFAYVSDSPPREVCVCLDGEPMPGHWDQVSNPFFSPDNKHLAYSAVKSHEWKSDGTGTTTHHEECVMLDGKSGPIYDKVYTYQPWRGGRKLRAQHCGSFVTDSTVAYFAQRDGQVYRVVQGAANP